MNELYWITRLDVFASFIRISFIVSIIMLGIAVLICVIAKLDDNNEDVIYLFTKVIKKIFYALIATGLLGALVPTTKEAIAIIGVGETIDYIKSNDKAKELPDKCIDALDKFIDSYNE